MMTGYEFTNINFTCDGCKEPFSVPAYLSDPRIVTNSAVLEFKETYVALVTATAVCPHCGTINKQTCYNDIFISDIINLATRRYR